MHFSSGSRVLIGSGMVALIIASFCGVALHHAMSMANMSSSSCGTTYFLATLPQPLQGRGFVALLIGILLLAVAHLFRASGEGRASAAERIRALAPPKSYGYRSSVLFELFRRGVLHPRVFAPAIIHP